jgi:hypothetical protein
MAIDQSGLSRRVKGNFGVATGSSQDEVGEGQWVVVPYGYLSRRGSCRFVID